MNYSSSHKPQKLNLDKGRKYLDSSEMWYALNHDVNNVLGKGTPQAGNYPACDMEMPAGENYRGGSYRSDRTNESYAWIYNSNGVHFISRINSAGECEVVFVGDCLQLSANPSYEIIQSRAYMRVEKSDCANRHGKYLIWVDGNTEIPGYLDVDASIATNNFTTPFFTKCEIDPCDYISLCVPQPCGCLHAEFLPLPAEEIGWSNHLVDVGIKLMYKHEYYDGRMSEWSDRSTLYYQDSKGCFNTGAGFSRCLKMRLPVGNPMVTRIHVGFNKSEFDESGNNIWYQTEVIEKYKKYNSTNQYWYERDYSEEVQSTFSEDDCSFDYLFCNDKQCKIVDPKEVTRVYNPIPRKAQGIITIKDAIGLFNYELGNCPIDKNEIDKVIPSVNCVTSSSLCVTEYATVTVRAIIYNDVEHRSQFIYRLTGAAGNVSLPDVLTDTAYFGGLSNVAPTFTITNGYDQQFYSTTRNFIAYIEGTDVWGEMSQWYSSKNFTNTKKGDVISGISETVNRAAMVAQSNNGGFMYQEVKLKVKKGTRGFLRLASHHSTEMSADTSTFVSGILADIRTYRGNEHLIIDNTNEEIYFDTCDGNVELFQSFIIRDNAVGSTTVAFYGYVKDASGRPVEGARIVLPYLNTVPVTDEGITDHNGFYHIRAINPDTLPSSILVKVEQDCAGNFVTIQTEIVAGNAGQNTSHDITITSVTYKEEFYFNATMKVTNCEGEPVGGIRVALSGSKYRSTNGEGIANFRIRNYQTRNRVLRGIVMDHSGCFSLDCSSACNPCMPTSTSVTPPCYQGKGTVPLATVQINTASAFASKKGLKSGGLYPMAMMIQSSCGKISAAYELPALRIPKTQDKGELTFCDYSYDATGVTFPFDGCMKILRGENLNNYELQWMVDKIERTGDGKIKLTIQSLNDYNAKYFFKTNTIYQYLKGDRVEFISNGDGKIFTTSEYGLLNYLTLSPFHDSAVSGKVDAPADYFNQLLIEDDGKLDNLVEGAIIELQRSKECLTDATYFDICANVQIVDGKLVNETGTFTSFDTFLVNRTLTYKKDGKTVVSPSQTFEHHSPSDFWGDHLNDTGKAYFVNLFENEKRYERSISINAPLRYNYFGDLVKTFDAPNQGAITAMNIVDGKVILAVCEHDYFITQTADELVRVGGDGIIRALPGDAIIADPQPKISGQYGCQYPHIGSIYFGDGYAFWADVNKGHYILCNYSSAQIAGVDKAGNTSVQMYTSKRFQDIETLNRGQQEYLNHYKFAVGFNIVTKNLHATIKTLRQPAINNEKGVFIKKNDTIVYSPITDDFLTFHSATPEGYSNMDLFDGKGCAMVMYFNGVPYITPINPVNYNEFFGIATDWIIGVVLNQYPTKIKIPIALEIESTDMWYVPKDGIKTEEVNFTSEIPAIRVKKNESKYNAEFLNNVNSKGGLYNGQKPRSYATSVLLIRDNTENLKYNSVDSIKQLIYGEIDLILIKYAMSEQSGFDQNL